MKKNQEYNGREYPIIDEHRRHYVLHPVMKENCKWVCAEVLLGKKGGYISPEGNPTKNEFETEADCKKACNIHNSYHFGKTAADRKWVIGLIWESMRLSNPTPVITE